MSITLKGNAASLNGMMEVPGDKSISHRAVILGSIANGRTTVSNFLFAEDCLSTIECMRQLGVKIEADERSNHVIIHGKGIESLKEPSDVLYTGNSGTTTRLLIGLLSGTNFYTVIKGDESIQRRPMDRVVHPLRLMGANIDGRDNGLFTPISIRGNKLSGINYHLPVASAQVKSALLLAGLQANGELILTGNIHSRDHTERMLTQFGVVVASNENLIRITKDNSLTGTNIMVPGDFSSAAFFIVMAMLVTNSSISIKNVGLNPTRTGLLDVIKMMGGKFEISDLEVINEEPRGTITVQYSPLNSVTINGELIPRVIDEIPIISLLATQAEGTTIIKNASELKVKESNRIKTVVQELSKLGAQIEELEDGLKIYGKSKLHGGCSVQTHGDHRIGMMLAAASLICKEEIEIEDESCISISYPSFFQDLQKIVHYH